MREFQVTLISGETFVVEAFADQIPDVLCVNRDDIQNVRDTGRALGKRPQVYPAD
jgi:hypothetical protein